MIPEDPTREAVAAQRAAFLAWRAAANDDLERHDWTPAFRRAAPPYPFTRLKLDDMPLARLDRPLGQARIALITSAGVYRTDQPAFDAANPDGDPSYRVIPIETDGAQLALNHEHYDHRFADEDLNAVYPVERLREAAASGLIGSVGPVVLSFMGFLPDASQATEDLAPAFVRALRAMGADGALLVPV